MVLWHAVQTHSIFIIFFLARITRCLTWVRDMTWSCSHSEVVSRKRLNESLLGIEGDILIWVFILGEEAQWWLHYSLWSVSLLGSMTHAWALLYTSKIKVLFLIIVEMCTRHPFKLSFELHLLQHCCWYVICIHLFPDWFCSWYYGVYICRSVPGNRDNQIGRALNQKILFYWKFTQSLDTASSAKHILNRFAISWRSSLLVVFPATLSALLLTGVKCHMEGWSGDLGRLSWYGKGHSLGTSHRFWSVFEHSAETGAANVTDKKRCKHDSVSETQPNKLRHEKSPGREGALRMRLVTHWSEEEGNRCN